MMKEEKRAVIRIKNLALRTVIGTTEYERREKQDVIINVDLEVDASKAVETDNIEYALDYRTLTKRIIQAVEDSDFFLLEGLTDFILRITMDMDGVLWARVEVDKPHALRFADSVSVEMRADRK
jgi:D-erythro-7,8-dihydroneopterin triphosphate epimerase